MSGYMKAILGKGKAAVAEQIAKLEKDSKIYAGDPALDWCIGGWARNRINLIYGPHKSGKSAITAMAAAAIQKEEGGWVIIFDSEYYYKDERDQAKRLAAFGLDLEKTLVISSNKIAELFYGLASLEKDIQSGDLKVSAIVVDSWGGIQSDQAESKIEENKADTAGNSFGGNAKFMNPILGQLLRICAENGVTLFAVQHCIRDMDTGGWHLLGGERLRFLTNRTLFVQGSQGKQGMLLEGENILGQNDKYSDELIVGKKILARCEKSRSVVEGRKAEFFINFDECRFAKPELSLFNLATKLKVIVHPVNPETGKENKMWWQYPAGEIGMKLQGKNFIEQLKEDRQLFSRVLQDCMKSSSKDASGGQVGDEEVAAVSVGVEEKEKGRSKRESKQSVPTVEEVS